jgi:mevalonate pyrophosphate decarboxylase
MITSFFLLYLPVLGSKSAGRSLFDKFIAAGDGEEAGEHHRHDGIPFCTSKEE